MNSVILIRHTATDQAGTFCGHTDPALNALGESQLADLVEKLRPLRIDRVCSSDLRRARQVAEAIAAPRGLQVCRHQDWREIFFGRWEGLAWHQVQQQFPAEAEQWMRAFPCQPAPGGESWEDFENRVTTAFCTLMSDTAADTAAIVCHRGVIQCLLTKVFLLDEWEAWRQTAEYGSIVVRSFTEESKHSAGPISAGQKQEDLQ